MQGCTALDQVPCSVKTCRAHKQRAAHVGVGCWSHSSCMQGADLLMLGPACSSGKPATMGILCCCAQAQTNLTRLLNQAHLLVLNATCSYLHGLARLRGMEEPLL